MAAPTAGYSGTPLHRKLGIAPEMPVLVVGVPAGLGPGPARPRRRGHGPDPGRPRAVRRGGGVLPGRGDPRRRLPELLTRVTQKGRLWICWPKKASGVPTDLDDNVVRRLGLAAGVVDVKVCAVDATWSGLCFMTRLRDRIA